MALVPCFDASNPGSAILLISYNRKCQLQLHLQLQNQPQPQPQPGLRNSYTTPHHTTPQPLCTKIPTPPKSTSELHQHLYPATRRLVRKLSCRELPLSRKAHRSLFPAFRSDRSCLKESLPRHSSIPQTIYNPPLCSRQNLVLFLTDKNIHKAFRRTVITKFGKSLNFDTESFNSKSTQSNPSCIRNQSSNSPLPQQILRSSFPAIPHHNPEHYHLETHIICLSTLNHKIRSQ
ncbi:hypothetical protein VTL71DRAFT_451 [Oculimacula yallundae]|uniref:Uncharacterized protein n=1 Tax=Oculimacula yallundae TaxID=86028 RepID=A0ABR4D045_9HELO